MPSISEPSGSLQSAIDAAALEALQTASGNELLKHAIKSYLAAADEMHTRLEAAMAAARWQEAEEIARCIAGLARDMGFLALSTAARGLMDASHDDPHRLRNEAQMVIIEHERLRLELAGVCLEPVA